MPQQPRPWFFIPGGATSTPKSSDLHSRPQGLSDPERHTEFNVNLRLLFFGCVSTSHSAIVRFVSPDQLHHGTPREPCFPQLSPHQCPLGAGDLPKPDAQRGTTLFRESFSPSALVTLKTWPKSYRSDPNFPTIHVEEARAMSPSLPRPHADTKATAALANLPASGLSST